MINVLQHALKGVESVYLSSKIQVTTKIYAYDKGYPVTTDLIENSMAYVEPLKDSEAMEYANGVIDSTKFFKFYILGKDKNKILISKIEPKQSYILFENEKYRVVSVNDRSLDGFYSVVGALENVAN